MQIGAYSLDLYCDMYRVYLYDGVTAGYHLAPDGRTIDGAMCQFVGPNESSCKRQARKLGWRLSAKGDACPYCVKQARQVAEWRKQAQVEGTELPTA